MKEFGRRRRKYWTKLKKLPLGYEEEEKKGLPNLPKEEIIKETFKSSKI